MNNSNKQRVLRGVGLHFPPYLFRTTDGGLKGPFVNVINELVKQLDLRFELYQPPDNSTGRLLSNGKWTGLVGAIQRNISDIEIIGVLPSLERSQLVTYSSTVYEAKVSIAGAAPPPTSVDITKILLVFDNNIWIGLFISMIILIMGSAINVEVDKSGSPKIKFREIFSVIFCYISAVFLEGTPRSPPTLHGRFLYGIWWIIMLILATTFGSFFRSIMMKPRVGEKFDTLKSLADNIHRVQSFVWKNTAVDAYFRKGQSRELKIIGQSTQGVSDQEELFSTKVLNIVAKGKAVILHTGQPAHYALRQRCSEVDIQYFYFMKEPIGTFLAPLSFRRGFDSNLTEEIKIRVSWMFESHLITKWIEDESIYQPPCKSTFSREDRALGFEDLRGIFNVLLITQLLSAIGLLSEIIWYYTPILKRWVKYYP